MAWKLCNSLSLVPPHWDLHRFPCQPVLRVQAQVSTGPGVEALAPGIPQLLCLYASPCWDLCRLMPPCEGHRLAQDVCWSQQRSTAQQEMQGPPRQSRGIHHTLSHMRLLPCVRQLVMCFAQKSGSAVVGSVPPHLILFCLLMCICTLSCNEKAGITNKLDPVGPVSKQEYAKSTLLGGESISQWPAVYSIFLETVLFFRHFKLLVSRLLEIPS